VSSYTAIAKAATLSRSWALNKAQPRPLARLMPFTSGRLVGEFDETIDGSLMVPS
jgi:hypothetical protein